MNNAVLGSFQVSSDLGHQLTFEGPLGLERIENHSQGFVQRSMAMKTTWPS